MALRVQKLSKAARATLLCVGSVLFLFPAMYGNSWHIVDRGWLANHVIRMESFIVGRLVQSRQHGILSAGGLPGQGSPNSRRISDPDQRRLFQYRAYLDNVRFRFFHTYKSQIGGQGIFFSLLDRAIPLSPRVKLKLYYGVTTLLLVLCLTAITLWFYWELGLVPALFVLASLGIAQWLFLFGRDLWWSTWAFYLPMAVLMHLLRRSWSSLNHGNIVLGTVVFLAVFTKCLFNGYEYITTALVMMVVPLVFYGILDRWGLLKLNKRLAIAAVAAVLAVFFSFGILCFQIGSVSGGFIKGVQHIVFSFQKRTYGNASDFPQVYRKGLEASVGKVVGIYLEGAFLTHKGPHRFIIRYRDLVILFLAASAALFFLSKDLSERERQRNLALVLSTWFSLLAPLSWFVIFKAHSFVHTFMNFIVWQMPFTLFGFAILGVLVQNLAPRMRAIVER